MRTVRFPTMDQQSRYATPTTTLASTFLVHNKLTACSGNTSTKAYSLGDFDKVPAEIRNEIYEYALTTPSVITIKRHEDRPAGSRERTKKPWKLCGTVIVMRGRQKRRVACVKGTGIGLLKVSQGVHIEAAPIFYHNNSFLFQIPWALSTLVNKINEMAFHLADIEIEKIHGSRTLFFGYVLEEFRTCSEPRRIAFRVPSGYLGPSENPYSATV